jgi:hypothetical protein
MLAMQSQFRRCYSVIVFEALEDPITRKSDAESAEMLRPHKQAVNVSLRLIQKGSIAVSGS